jgi:hypothetical protein
MVWTAGSALYGLVAEVGKAITKNVSKHLVLICGNFAELQRIDS